MTKKKETIIDIFYRKTQRKYELQRKYQNIYKFT